jgi:tetratricopeptide (TPR) repeat protein
MKVAHHSKELPVSGEDMLKEAEAFERDRKLPEAAKLYLRYLKKLPGNEYAFSRLMIIYRKLGDAEKELEIIDRGIKTFQDIFKKNLRLSPTRKTVEISRKLMKAMGLADNKGIELNEREPVRKWKKRKELLEKRRDGAKRKRR